MGCFTSQSLAMSAARWEQAAQLRQHNREVLGTAPRLAKFLCGIGSPKFTRAKLTKHELFGVFENSPYQQVLERAEQLS